MKATLNFLPTMFVVILIIVMFTATIWGFGNRIVVYSTEVYIPSIEKNLAVDTAHFVKACLSKSDDYRKNLLDCVKSSGAVYAELVNVETAETIKAGSGGRREHTVFVNIKSGNGAGMGVLNVRI